MLSLVRRVLLRGWRCRIVGRMLRAGEIKIRLLMEVPRVSIVRFIEAEDVESVIFLEVDML